MSWAEKDNSLTKTFNFENFKQAIDFVNEVAKIAEQENHHPDIKIFDYNKVEISLTTHDAGNEGKVTEKDKKLAVHIDSYKD